MLFTGAPLTGWRHWDPGQQPPGMRLDARAESSAGGQRFSAARWPAAGNVLSAAPGYGDIYSEARFGAHRLHLDFQLPVQPDWVPAKLAGTGGVFIAGRYEIELRGAAPESPPEHRCGALNGFKAPDVEVAMQPGVWQELEVEYTPQGEGGRISVWLNGTRIHHNADARRAHAARLHRVAGRVAGPGDRCACRPTPRRSATPTSGCRSRTARRQPSGICSAVGDLADVVGAEVVFLLGVQVLEHQRHRLRQVVQDAQVGGVVDVAAAGAHLVHDHAHLLLHREILGVGGHDAVAEQAHRRAHHGGILVVQPRGVDQVDQVHVGGELGPVDGVEQAANVVG